MFRNLAVSSILFSTVAAASSTRVSTLQNVAGLQDGSDIFIYPSLATKYSLALIELGTSTGNGAYAGAVAPISEQVSLGAAINRHTWQSGYNNSDTSLFMMNRFMYAMTSESSTGKDDNFLVKGDRSIDLLAGYNLNSDSSIGLRISNAKEREKSTTTTTSTSSERSANAMQVALGYSRFNSSRLDASFSFDVTDRYKYSKTTASTKTAIDLNSMTTRLDVRAYQNADGAGYFTNAVVVNRSAKAKMTSSGSEKDGKFTDQVYNLGGGYVYKKPENATMLLAAANGYMTTSKGGSSSDTGASATSSISTSTEQVKVTAQWIEASLSGESKFYDNFGAMFGTNYTVFGSYKEDNKITATKDEAEITSPSDANLYSLGLFWGTEKARVDATVTKVFLHNGPHFVAGNQTSPLFGRIAATFNF
jgi:hypothetical protein